MQANGIVMKGFQFILVKYIIKKKPIMDAFRFYYFLSINSMTYIGGMYSTIV